MLGTSTYSLSSKNPFWGISQVRLAIPPNAVDDLVGVYIDLKCDGEPVSRYNISEAAEASNGAVMTMPGGPWVFAKGMRSLDQGWLPFSSAVLNSNAGDSDPSLSFDTAPFIFEVAIPTNNYTI